ncbi:hypothetical protein PCC8801_0016 [Rippkaea orientalis PCC 8801]|uniref:Uncharacterized protein n=1 Tax=Rippkaea orientalis (strain PCC 8801 / RF-1) TaxID=41431 RepID=B7JZG3_RIPO1|nr:hypothetical protein [Rippkaea orientalis]ACK64123.1 hypothetical protein PCC8801_0016 [Rippkaea orientalis PCC 8801]
MNLQPESQEEQLALIEIYDKLMKVESNLDELPERVTRLESSQISVKAFNNLEASDSYVRYLTWTKNQITLIKYAARETKQQLKKYRNRHKNPSDHRKKSSSILDDDFDPYQPLKRAFLIILAIAVVEFWIIMFLT